MSENIIAHTDCLFQQPWWLDAVAPGAWDAVVAEHGGRVVGRLPYVKKNGVASTVSSCLR